MATKIIETFVTGSKPDFDVSSGAYETVDLNKELTVSLENLGEENVPDFALFRYIEDAAKVSELFLKNTNKQPLDNVNITELVQLAVTFIRDYEDQANISDPFTSQWTAQRYFEEGPYFSPDYVEYDYVKTTPGVRDFISNAPNKNVVENVLLTSIVSKQIEVNIVEQLGILDNYSSSTIYIRSLEDSSSATDVPFNSQGFGRQLPFGYFSLDYVDLDYFAEKPGYDQVKVTEVVTTTLNG